ncbi:hypothetical protein [Streptomyces sp. NPDC055099]
MTTADFRPTHVVPQDGLPAWEAPDVNRPTTPLDALLPVQLVDRLGDWARIVCANDWSAWVDGRLLVAVPADPPAAGHPLTRTADPAPLLARTEAALADFRRATRDLAAGETDADTFRQRTRGLRVGVVVDGDAMWLYDAEHERWVYCDGTRLSTYAVEEPPSAHGTPGEPDGSDGALARERDAGGGGGTVRPEPTQVVGGSQDAGGPVGPEPTLVVEGAGDADRVSGRYGETGDPDGVASGGGAGSPEPTQVVEAVPSAGTARGGEGSEGLASASHGEDARRTPETYREEPAVAPGASPGPASAPGPSAEGPTRRIPPVVAGPGGAGRVGDG